MTLQLISNVTVSQCDTLSVYLSPAVLSMWYSVTISQVFNCLTHFTSNQISFCTMTKLPTGIFSGMMSKQKWAHQLIWSSFMTWGSFIGMILFILIYQISPFASKILDPISHIFQIPLQSFIIICKCSAHYNIWPNF